MQKSFLDMTPLYSQTSNGVFAFILKGVRRRTGAMPHC